MSYLFSVLWAPIGASRLTPFGPHRASRQTFDRRGILSTVSLVYDPEGIVATVILVGKQLLQELCYDGIKWDDLVLNNIHLKWEK